MRPISVILMAALAVTGCAAQAARDPAPVQAASSAPSTASSVPTAASLDGTEWRFVEVNGIAVPNGVNATLRLHGSRASGRTGCNAYGASFETGADGSAKFGQAMSTKMACLQPAGVMRVEKGVFDAFRNTAKVAIVNGELVMLDTAGKPLAKLQQLTP